MHSNFGFTPHSYFKCRDTLPLCLYLRPHPLGQWISSSPSTEQSSTMIQNQHLSAIAVNNNDKQYNKAPKDVKQKSSVNNVQNKMFI